VQDAELRLGPHFESRNHGPPRISMRLAAKLPTTAGRIAGLEVLDILDEPSAGPRWPIPSSKGGRAATRPSPTSRETILVYDLGGGTFDVTLVKLTPKRFQTLAIEGDVPPGRQGLGRPHRQPRGRGLHRQARRKTHAATPSR